VQGCASFREKVLDVLSVLYMRREVLLPVLIYDSVDRRWDGGMDGWKFLCTV
jgi:hypothetical protein